jgi:hypothetical protein
VRAAGAILVALVLLGSGNALAAHVQLQVSPASVAPGAKVRAFGNASPCRPGDQVTVISAAFPGDAFGGAGARYAAVRSGGAFSASGPIRAKLHVGKYAVTARCGGGNLGVVAYLRVM